MGKFYNSFNEFSDDLYGDLSWRKHELRILQKVIPSDVGKKQLAFLRMSIPILYAHWEGFINNSSLYYLKYVKSRRLKNSELMTQFITLSLRHKLNLIEAKNIEKQSEIVDFVICNFNERSNIPLKNIINTKSNLNFKVFKEILFIIGIDKDLFINYQSIIDDLIELRNYIAHGEDKIVDKTTFDNFYSEVTSLMDYYKTELENSAINEKYKRYSTQQCI